MKSINLKSIFLVLTSILVTLLVIVAVYSNRAQFKNPVILRYKQVSAENNDHLKILESLPDEKKKIRFINEVKKINDINSFDNISKRTIIVPIVN
jgi:endonuclease V-like protein UPF0215 family